MSKMGRLFMASLMMASMAGMAPGLYDYDPGDGPWKNEDEAGRKRRLHRMNPVDTTEREFNIKGERIMARDRKTALKIYANRHPETKNRKRRKK